MSYHGGAVTAIANPCLITNKRHTFTNHLIYVNKSSFLKRKCVKLLHLKKNVSTFALVKFKNQKARILFILHNIKFILLCF